MPTPADEVTLDQIHAALDKRREIAERLDAQDRYIAAIIRDARRQGHTWHAIADAAGTSEPAVIQRSRRKS